MVLSTPRAASSLAKDGWRTVRFGNVVRNVDVSEKDPLSKGLSRVVGLEHIEPGSLHIREWGDIAEGTSFARTFRAGKVLFGKRRAYQRKVAYAEFDGICSGDILVFEAVSEELLPELLPFIVQSEPFFDHALQTSAGSLSPRTKWAELAKYEFALPPKDEQRRIAEILWAADDLRQRRLELLDSVVRTQEVLRNASVVGARATSAEPRGEGLPQLPPGWTQATAEDLCTALVTKGATPTGFLSRESSVPFIRVNNLSFDGSLNFDLDPMYMDASAERSMARSEVHPGDVLMNIVGPPMGKVSVVPGDHEKWNINQAIVRFRVEQKYRVFFLNYLMSDWAMSWLMKRTKKTSGQMNLTLQLCRALTVPVPPHDDLVELTRVFEESERGVVSTRTAVASDSRFVSSLAGSIL